MKNPFKKGDTVYHPGYGKVFVGDVDDNSVGVRINGHRHLLKLDYLSFEPWPKPVHIRPWEPSLNKGDVVLVRMDGGCMHGVEVMVEYEHYILCTKGESYAKTKYKIFRTGEQLK